MTDLRDTARQAISSVVREEWGRLTALLVARYRRLDLVEDALGDAVERAARNWPTDGVPENPAGWLLTVARNRITDRLRAEAIASRHAAGLVTVAEAPAQRADPGGIVHDDLLRLVLMCTHPALAPEAAAALSLRLVLGVPTADIARLFLVTEPTMAARITRAKKKIVASAIPFGIPGAGVLPGRLDAVAQIAYLAFTGGYAPGSGPDAVRAELAGEAIRLTRVVLGACPTEPALSALLALMLFQHSRRDARVSAAGELVLLPDQDRSAWHRTEIDEAAERLRALDAPQELTPVAASYLLQARIAAEHALAPTAGETRWDRIVAHYDQLLQLMPSPAAALARAVAVAEASGPEAGLAALADIELTSSHRVHAVRAELLARAGRCPEALDAYDAAIDACANDAERAHLTSRRAELSCGTPRGG